MWLNRPQRGESAGPRVWGEGEGVMLMSCFVHCYTSEVYRDFFTNI